MRKGDAFGKKNESSLVAIKVENLSKLYQLGQIGTGTLSRDLNRWWANIRGKEDPYAKIGQVNDRTKKAETDYVWALKDISFEVRKGEVLGIIGRNGAGKSTLLKILSKITTPTQGKIYTNGRIASLLEVGTGFHPEMTGRENIFMNGAILGMRRREIQQKLNEIIDFAGVEAYIDTPVKRYSSGMYVRLAFSVAAFLDPEVLIVDEVLAVGDSEFQKKCLGRIKNVSNQDGRTVIFVSHNMAAVKAICNHGLYIRNGQIAYQGLANDTITNYLSASNILDGVKSFSSGIDHPFFTLHEMQINVPGEDYQVPICEDDAIEFQIDLTLKIDPKNLHLTLMIRGEDGVDLFTFSHIHSDIYLKEGLNKLKCFFPKGFLNIGTYFISAYLIENKRSAVFIEKDIIGFEVQPGRRELGAWSGKEPGFIKPNFSWELY